MKWNRSWTLSAGALLMGMAGCASQPSRIRCDDRLEPINAPAPKVTSVPSVQGSSATDSRVAR
jgi:hypothetical protein